MTDLTDPMVIVVLLGLDGRNVALIVHLFVCGSLNLITLWNSVLGIRTRTLVLLLELGLSLEVLWRLRPCKVANVRRMTLRSGLLDTAVMNVIL